MSKGKKSSNYSNPSNSNDVVRETRGGKQRRNDNRNAKSTFLMNSNTLHNVRRDHNDSEWFMDQRGMVEDAARYGTYQPVGRPWLRYGFPTENGTLPASNFSVPSALICEYVPIPGVSRSSTSAMSIAGQQVFQTIRRSLNKVLVGYQFADPMMGLTAFSSLVIMAREMIRDYKIANSWSSDNFAYPYGILHALGYNEASAHDLLDNMADYRNRFNTLMYEASSIFIPFETNQLLKYIWMSDGLWGDKDNPKAQVYGYMSMGYYTYEEQESEEDPGSKAVFHYFGRDKKLETNALFHVKLVHFEECITKLRDSDSFNYMMSDLRTAFPDVSGYVFDSINETESMTIDYNDIMLRQFQNLRTLPPVEHSSTGERNALAARFNITQSVENNSILAHPSNIPADLSMITQNYLEAGLEAIEDHYMPTSMLVNWSSSSPDHKEVIENTNGIVMWHYDSGDRGYDIEEGDISCYVPMMFHMVYRDDTTTPDSWKSFEFTSWNFRTNADASGSMIPSHFWLISMFDWFPILHDVYVVVEEDKPTYTAVYPLVEDDVLAPFTQHQLRALNQAEQYALWRVANTANF